jgi:predicted Zn-ribbon and HTH transcriptional regulator
MEDAFEGRDATIRQRLSRSLAEAEYEFEALRLALDLSARELEEELRHVERSARRSGRRLHVEAPLCRECGFDFPGRAERHLHPPGRCPRCRSRRIAPPRFRIRG